MAHEEVAGPIKVPSGPAGATRLRSKAVPLPAFLTSEAQEQFGVCRKRKRAKNGGGPAKARNAALTGTATSQATGSSVDKLQAELMMALYTEVKAVLRDLPFEAYAIHKVVCRNDPSRQKNSTAEVLAALERELPRAQAPLGAMPQVMDGAGDGIFPRTRGDLLALSEAQLDALEVFYGDKFRGANLQACTSQCKPLLRVLLQKTAAPPARAQ